jgi:hypothetical protein
VRNVGYKISSGYLEALGFGPVIDQQHDVAVSKFSSASMNPKLLSLKAGFNLKLLRSGPRCQSSFFNQSKKSRVNQVSILN